MVYDSYVLVQRRADILHLWKRDLTSFIPVRCPNVIHDFCVCEFKEGDLLYVLCGEQIRSFLIPPSFDRKSITEEYVLESSNAKRICVLDPTHILTFNSDESQTSIILHTKETHEIQSDTDSDFDLAFWSNILVDTVNGSLSTCFCCSAEEYIPHWIQIDPGLAGSFLGGLAGFNKSHSVVCTFDSGESRTFIWKPDTGELKSAFKSRTFQGITNFISIPEHNAIATIHRTGSITVHRAGENGYEVQKYQLPFELDAAPIWQEGSFYGAGNGRILNFSLLNENEWRDEAISDTQPWLGVKEIARGVGSGEILIITNRQITKHSFETRQVEGESFTEKIQQIRSLELMIANELKIQIDQDSRLKRISATLMLKKTIQAPPKISVSGQLCVESVVLHISLRFSSVVPIPGDGDHIYLRIKYGSNTSRLVPFWTTQPTAKFSFDIVLSADLWKHQDVRLHFYLTPTQDGKSLVDLGSHVVDLFDLSKPFILCPLKSSRAKVETLLTRTVFVADYMLKEDAETFVEKLISSIDKRKSGSIWNTMLPLGWKFRLKGNVQDYQGVKGVEFNLFLWSLEDGEMSMNILCRTKAALLRRILPFLAENPKCPNDDDLLRAAFQKAEENLAQIQRAESQWEHLLHKEAFPDRFTEEQRSEKQISELMRHLQKQILERDGNVYLF